MSDRFLKFIPSEEAMYLLTQKGHAFRLLTIIAQSARRYEGGSDGLKIGEALIGGFENYDMTERNYRTAKDILMRRRHIEIVETCRTRKKVTTGVTTIGTKVRLLSSSVYDINCDDGNDRTDDRPTTDRRPTDDEQEQQERNKNKQEEQQPQTPKGACVVFPCLEKIKDPSVSEREKIRLTKKCFGKEQVLENAIEAILHPSFEPQDSLLKSLRAAIKWEWKPPIEKEDYIKINKKKALELESKGHPVYRIEACNTYLEIVAGPISHIVQYELQSEKFDRQISEHLKIGKQA